MARKTWRLVPEERREQLERAAVPLATKAFHYLYYRWPLETWRNTYFMGHKIQKNPMDLWIYQEILYEVQPDLIIETGTMWGGSALFLATFCDTLGTGRVVTVDIKARAPRPVHDRITYVTGSSTDPGIVADLTAQAAAAERVLVILDSDHSAAHVAEELRCLSPLVTMDSYLIVEDTHVNGRPVLRDHGPGPFEAVHPFLAKTDQFEIDKSREKLRFTWNYDGYLRRVRPAG
jgi:cephalosporin hydroxylase